MTSSSPRNGSGTGSQHINDGDIMLSPRRSSWSRLGLPSGVVDPDVLSRTQKHFKERCIKLPTFSELADPSGQIDADIQKQLQHIDPNEPHPLNLFRVHWYNDPKSRGIRKVPFYYEIPKSLSGVDARIVVMIGAWFPMVQCQKVIAAYGCLAPRVITGQFDPEKHRAVWPSTGREYQEGSFKNDSSPTLFKMGAHLLRRDQPTHTFLNDETLQTAGVCPIFKLFKTTAGDREVAAPPLQIDHPFRSTPGIDRHSPFRVVCL